MFTEIVNVNTPEGLDGLAVRLLDESSFRQLQEEMAAKDVTFHRKDYWPEDRLSRRASSPSTMKKAFAEMAKEPEEKRALHVLQLVMATAPGARD